MFQIYSFCRQVDDIAQGFEPFGLLEHFLRGNAGRFTHAHDLVGGQGA